MKAILFICLIFLSSGSFSQKVEKYYDHDWKQSDISLAKFYSVTIKTDSGFLREDYFIHTAKLQMKGKYTDSEGKIPNGYFRYFYANGFLESSGQFIGGKREGLWLRYHTNGMMSDSIYYEKGEITGTRYSWHQNGYPSDSTSYDKDRNAVQITWYDNGNVSSAGYLTKAGDLTGRWQFFHRNGKASSIETYKEGILLEKQYFDEEGRPIADTTNKDIEVSFQGKAKSWKKYLEANVHFPEKYMITNSNQAVVVVDFSVNEDGVVDYVFVSVPFYPEFDEIAKRVIEKSPKWNPAIDHNRRVRTWHRQSVAFKQEE